MTERRFVLTIDEDAFEASVQHIGKTLAELEGNGLIYSSARTIDALLEDVSQGIADSLLLKTKLVQYELIDLLRDKVGKDFKHCTIQWI